MGLCNKASPRESPPNFTSTRQTNKPPCLRVQLFAVNLGSPIFYTAPAGQAHLIYKSSLPTTNLSSYIQLFNT